MSAKPQPALKPMPDKRIAATEQTLTSSNEFTADPSAESIAQLAYALWQQRGCPVGSSEIDWLEAEQRLSRPNSSTKDSPLTRTAVSPL